MEILESPLMRHREGESFLFVKFKWDQVRNNAASDKAGRPIYDKALKIFISQPANAKNQEMSYEIERHIWRGDDQEPEVRIKHDLVNRFREVYEAFKKNNSAAMAGTPISELPGLDIAQVAALREMQIHTVEALSALSDSQLFPGARKWREMAKAYLQKAEGNAPLQAAIAENEKLKDEVAQLREQVQALAAQMGGEGEEKRGPGRPKKAA